MTSLSMPEPKQGKVPMQANIYQFAQRISSKLTPLFPYDGPGDIVPTAAALEDDGTDPGYFIHYNSVDEIYMCFGATGGKYRPGQVAVGAREHGVGGKMEPGNSTIMTVTQRQAPEGPQEEAIGFVCTSCNTEIFRHAFPIVHSEDKDAVNAFGTIAGSFEGVQRYASDPALRVCGKCGHHNDPFPHPHWGWQKYLQNTKIVEAGRQSLAAVAGA